VADAVAFLKPNASRTWLPQPDPADRVNSTPYSWCGEARIRAWVIFVDRRAACRINSAPGGHRQPAAVAGLVEVVASESVHDSVHRLMPARLLYPSRSFSIRLSRT